MGSELALGALCVLISAGVFFFFGHWFLAAAEIVLLYVLLKITDN